jgi:ATP-dependent helicase HepA
MSDWSNLLVIAKDDRRLFGKVLSRDDTDAEVEFFLSVADREVRRLPANRLSHAALPKQTRAFIRLPNGIWRVGRVLDRFKDQDGSFDYTIRFPNDEVAELSERECFVRCLDRHADPSMILAARCIETEFFANYRRRALRRLRELNSAAHGLTGVISAAVELLPHQVATVRRVVTDRKQRYLLADEVGLGKTIEAGLIIRQLQLDDPSMHFVIAVPRVLVGQWSSELVLKCLVAPESATVIAHEDLSSLPPSAQFDMLVVDEAHRLVEANMATTESEVTRSLADLAARVPRLLLLSATPALGDERKLLALLNLLDPQNYSLDDLDGFTQRVAERQQIGRLLLAMRPDAPAFVVRKQVAAAKSMFPQDPIVAEEADRVAGMTDDAPRADAVAGLREHIASTYRIHQRLIRSRRVDVEQWTMRPRGPHWPAFGHVRYCHLSEENSAELADLLERWRGEATLALEERPTLLAGVTARWDLLLETAWQGSDIIAAFASKALPVFDGEQDILAQIAQLPGTTVTRAESIAKIARDWAQTLGNDLSGRPRKIVCFVSHTNSATRVAKAMATLIGAARVVTLIGNPAGSEETVKTFSKSSVVRILVCDRASEEGLNLQFVHGILHADMPTDASRVEQRIGRLDRFGRKIDSVEHRIVLPDDNDAAPWAVWISLLANGFRVFHRSSRHPERPIAGLVPSACPYYRRGSESAQTALME